jgi:hypothetical protein
MTVMEHKCLLDIDPYKPKQIAEIAAVLLDKCDRVGWNDLPVDEQVQLRLVRTLFEVEW